MTSVGSSRPATSVRLLLDTAADMGVERGDCLATTGLSVREVYDERSRVTLAQELRTIENFVDRAPDSVGLGAAVARRMHVNAFGIWGFAILSSPTVRAAVETAIEYLVLSLAVVEMTLVETESDEVALELETHGLDDGVRRFVLERQSMVTINFVRELVRHSDIRGVRIESTSTDSAYPASLESKIGLAVVGGRARDAIVLPTALLDASVPRSDPVTLRYCLEQCRALTAELDEPDCRWSKRVRDAILLDIGVEHQIGTTASRLAVSERTLRRRLAEEGTTFREIYAATRLSIAHELLETAGLGVESVASRVGYAEPASFVRAFTRRYGTAPGRVRRA